MDQMRVSQLASAEVGARGWVASGSIAFMEEDRLGLFLSP